MGASSSQLNGFVSNAIPSISYAYSTANTKAFGVDFTFRAQAQGTLGLVTPYLVAPTTTYKCDPIQEGAAATGQSLRCSVQATALAQGLYTISLSQYSSCTPPNTFGVPTTRCGTELQSVNGAKTFSIVAQPTTTVTPTITVTETVTSGAFTITPTPTTVPEATTLATVYATTIVELHTVFETLTGFITTTLCPPSTSDTTTTEATTAESTAAETTNGSTTSEATTATETTSSTTSLNQPATTSNPSCIICNNDACLRSLASSGTSFVSFCFSFLDPRERRVTIPDSVDTACALEPARISSACSCYTRLATGTIQSPGHEKTTIAAVTYRKRGATEVTFAPPDYTFLPRQYSDRTFFPFTVEPTVTSTVPSTTVTDPTPVVSSGMATNTVTLPKTTRTDIETETVDNRVPTIAYDSSACKVTIE